MAPPSVFFEPTFDENREAFRTQIIRWDSGDDDAGRWATTGGNKNAHSGPLATHVFETPGTFVTTATTVGPDGEELTRTATIVVSDPDEVFSGESTVCVSRAASFEGAPPGCNEVETSDMDAVNSHIQPRTRILFRRGESWSLSKTLTLNVAGPGLIGAFGEGEEPIFSTAQTAVRFGDREPLTANDWRLTNLQIIGERSSASGLGVSVQTHDLLLHKLTVRGLHSAVSGGESGLRYWNDEGYGPHDMHHGLTFSELDVRSIIGGSGGNGVYIVGRRLASMGCHFEDSTEA